MARLLCEYHDAVRNFRPPGLGPGQIVCHGDGTEATGPLRHPTPPDRRRRMELFAGAYGLTGTEGLADEVIHQQEQVLDRARRLAADGHQPPLSWQRSGALDAVAGRIAWSRTNRSLFE